MIIEYINKSLEKTKKFKLIKHPAGVVSQNIFYYKYSLSMKEIWTDGEILVSKDWLFQEGSVLEEVK